MITVAVTGASGFLGRHTVAELKRAGHGVIAVGRDHAGAMRRNDTANNTGPLFEGVDAVIHLAAQLVSGPNIFIADYLDANVVLTERLFTQAHEAGVGRFVFASSRLVYSGELDRDATEADVAPNNAYGMSKWIAEQVITHHSARTRLPAASLRLSQLIGPGDSGHSVIGAFVRAAVAGGPIRVAGSGRAVRDFLDVRDAARAFRLAVEQPAVVGALNIGGGGHPIAHLAKAVAKLALIDDRLIEYTEVDHDDRTRWSLDCTRAATMLNWRPRYSLSEALLSCWPDPSP